MKNILIAILSLFTLAACTEEIDLDLDVAAPRPVISGIVSPVEQWVRLSKTSAYLKDTNRYPVTAQHVTISDGTNTYALEESKEEKGLYKPTAAINVVEGLEYKLNVQADFDGDGKPDTYTASSIVPKKVELDAITITPVIFNKGDDPLWFIKGFYQDWMGKSFYLVRTFINGEADYGMNSYLALEEPRTDGIYVKSQIIAVEFKRPNTKEEPLHDGDVIRIEFSSISEDYYTFLYAAGEEGSAGNPLFSGPPANIKGNISNGAIGVFSAYLVSSQEVMLDFATMIP